MFSLKTIKIEKSVHDRLKAFQLQEQGRLITPLTIGEAIDLLLTSEEELRTATSVRSPTSKHLPTFKLTKRVIGYLGLNKKKDKGTPKPKKN